MIIFAHDNLTDAILQIILALLYFGWCDRPWSINYLVPQTTGTPSNPPFSLFSSIP